VASRQVRPRPRSRRCRRAARGPWSRSEARCLLISVLCFIKGERSRQPGRPPLCGPLGPCAKSCVCSSSTQRAAAQARAGPEMQFRTRAAPPPREPENPCGPATVSDSHASAVDQGPIGLRAQRIKAWAPARHLGLLAPNTLRRIGRVVPFRPRWLLAKPGAPEVAPLRRSPRRTGLASLAVRHTPNSHSRVLRPPGSRPEPAPCDQANTSRDPWSAASSREAPAAQARTEQVPDLPRPINALEFSARPLRRRPDGASPVFAFNAI